MSDYGILTLDQAGQLADVIRATEGNRKVARLIDDYVFYGEARSIGDERGNFDFTSDARSQYLRVTLTGGFEAFWPIAELMDEVGPGLFVSGTSRRPTTWPLAQ